MPLKKVYGVGVGPGDRELITLKALRVLKEVNKVFVPISKLGRRSLAYEIIKDFIKDKHIEELLFPMVKDKNKLKSYWDEALRKILKEDGEVAIVTIGDPTLYSTFSYLWKLLKENGVEVEVINGVSSIFASAKALNMPLVEGDEKLCILPQGKDLYKYIDEFDTIIVMKTKNLKECLKDIMNRDDILIGLVKKASFNDEKVFFGKIKDAKFEEFNDYLSMAIIKKVKE
ncbi:precorrin-2 C20-methyltransferase [Methanocaldococcus villosus KIN24-T80]|uniref:Precorrin-2 C20-methyltransferase n=1 Tax=Methanocaldococcus villosus KIN24-T80 TaxID=1069083 RepID=N6V1I4_9EURY|nr:precorrin-2 C(20)-methyltransferase [Methanocaldococcus villosus]ENN96133.1 precorrin-2 C20-methyltransferase [Methanocaldococcus villosus KIN24-T80]